MCLTRAEDALTQQRLARARKYDREGMQLTGDFKSVPLDVLASSFEATFLVNELVRVVIRGLPAHVVAPDLLVFDQEDVTLRRWDGTRQVWRC